jgi:MFS family permease
MYPSSVACCRYSSSPRWLIWIDTTILGIALERIADPRTGLGATPGELQWAVGSYALLFATGPVRRRRARRPVRAPHDPGRRLTVFGAASIWAAWAGDATGLILARGLMGIGGAMMMPTSMAIIGATFPAERRAGAIAVWSASSGVGVALGPLLGGVLVDHFWWGSVFLVNLPVVAVALVGVLLVVPTRSSCSGRRPDPLGLVLSTGGLALLAYGLIEAGRTPTGPAGRCGPGARRCAGPRPVHGGRMAIGAAVVRPAAVPQRPLQRRQRRPRRAVLRHHRQMFYGNFYLQGARGMSRWTPAWRSCRARSGSPSAPSPAPGWPGASGSAGQRRRAAGRRRRVPGQPHVRPRHAAGVVLHRRVRHRVAMGMAIAPTVAAVVAVLPLDRMGAGSAVNNTVRQVGSVLGIALLGTILAGTYRTGSRRHSPGFRPRPGTPPPRRPSTPARSRSSCTGPTWPAAADDAFMAALHITAATGALVAFFGGVLLILAFRVRTSTVERDRVLSPTG